MRVPQPSSLTHARPPRYMPVFLSENGYRMRKPCPATQLVQVKVGSQVRRFKSIALVLDDSEHTYRLNLRRPQGWSS